MECDVPEVKRLPIDYLLTGLASTNDYPVYQVPEPDTVYLPIPTPRVRDAAAVYLPGIG